MSDFAQRFADWWRAPDPPALASILAEDVRLIQPLMPTTHTLAEAIAGFERILALVPDLHAEVRRSAEHGDAVFIEFTLRGTFGGRHISWEAVDRFTVREDGLASERVSWFDSAPLLAQMATRPRGWPASLRWIRSAFSR